MDGSNSNMSEPCIFIFDSTRLRSHLFFRYLRTSAQVSPILHPYLSAAMFGPNHIAQYTRHSEMRQKELDVDLAPLMNNDTYESSAEQFTKAVQAAHKDGKVPMANEHWFNCFKIDFVLGLIRGEIQKPEQLGRNPTHLPYEIFDSLKPIILIRHPALSIRSIYRDALKITKQRPGDEDFDGICMNRPLRILFDFFCAQGRQPVVVDAEDILWRTEEMTRNLCAAIESVEAGSLSDKWKPTSQAEMDRMNPLVVMLTKNILESSGIERPSEKPAEPSIEKTFQEWKQQYGDEVAEHLKKLAEENMPHYEYLRQFKA